MVPERKLILLPMDGSDQSMEVVRYISRAVNLVNAEIVLLSIIDKTPDVFWDPERDQGGERTPGTYEELGQLQGTENAGVSRGRL